MIVANLIFALLASQASSSPALSHLHAGVEADKQGNVDAAIGEFQKAIDADPKLALAFLDLGGAFLEKGEYANATPPLKRALELNPNIENGHRLLGYALLAQGYANDAIPHLEKAHDDGALGIALLDAGRIEEASVVLQKAVTKNPDDPNLLYYYGRASGLLSKQVFDTLESRFPDSARAHQMMAQDYAALREVPSAEREFNEAIRLRPQTSGLHMDLGYLYARSQQWDKAEEQFRLETELQPGNAEAAYRLGEAQMQLGKFHDALAALQKSDQLRHDMPETLYLLGKAAASDGDDALAQKSWQHLLTLQIDPSIAAQTHFGLAGIYRKQGKTADADREMDLFRQAQESAGRNADSSK
jgi:tetratricopeptide (TPR) repeat protein